MSNYIISHTRFKNNGLWHNGTLLSEVLNVDSVSVLDSLYKNLILSYPKFYKMDALCKLGILCAEPIMQDENVKEKFGKENTAIILSNKNSSLQTDIAYSKTRETFPSPALFVYTLANIVTGEISIKHKITGENAFFIEPSFNAELLHNYAEIVLQDSDAVLCGWLNDKDGFLYFVAKENSIPEKKATFIEHNANNINKLYTL